MPGKYCLFFLVVAINLILRGQHLAAWAGEEHVVEFPLVFPKERTEIKTSACLRVRERVYSADRAPWNSFVNEAQAEPESLLTKTIAAMQNNDIALLKELSHSRLGRDPLKFEEEASGYLRLFGDLQLGDVWGYYAFSDLLVFYFQVLAQSQPFFANFSFVREEMGSFGFLPYGTRSLTMQFVGDWFQSDWGPGKGQTPVYCRPSLLERMTHKVPLDKRMDKRLDNAVRPLASPPELLFIGRNFTDAEMEEGPYSALRDKIASTKDALKAERMSEYFDGFTEHGRKKVGDWFLAAQSEERQKYVDSILTHEPFYVINADPLFVVYSKTKSYGIQALYFVRDENSRFLWANAAYGTVYDSIFKGNGFIEAASGEKPFERWRISESRSHN